MGSLLSHLQCSRCGAEHPAGRLQNRCSCGGTLFARYALPGTHTEPDGRDGSATWAAIEARPTGLWRYRELLPVAGEPVSLGEPETPLLPLPRLSELWGADVYIKDDSGFAGASFKARGACVALTRAVELGVDAVVLPSAGNAGGAWAAYGARAGIDVTVTMAQSAPEVNKTEVIVAGARLELVDGTIADAGHRAAEIAAATGAFHAATFAEPYRLEGKKTCWLEVFEQLGRLSAGPGTFEAGHPAFVLPGTIVLPVGGGLAAIAVAKATEEVKAAGWAEGGGPVVVGVQAADCAPVARAFEAGATEVEPWAERPTTIAWGLRVPAPAEGALVLESVRRSGGSMLAAGENDMARAGRLMASKEGVWACPEGAATVWAAGRLAASGSLRSPVVLYNTASGAKYASAFAGLDLVG